MISVDNLYWILYENLLSPVGLDCWYYTPFGTMQNLNRHEFGPRIARRDDHVLFYFDQEPIWGEDFGPYDLVEGAWKSHTCKILANSELSDFKKHICRDRDMKDWYFFYHGFAALDWFRDGEFVGESVPISKVFCSLNHLTTRDRCYRMALTARLMDLGVTEKGNISFHGTQKDCIQELENHDSLLSHKDQSLIAQHLVGNRNLPMTLDHTRIDNSFSARFGHQEYKLWQQCFLSVVNETAFHSSKLHLTEKIFKPIVCARPFVLVGAPGNLAYLRRYGFKTFSSWIDESYDEESNNDRRLDMLAKEVAKLCDKSFDQLQKMYEDMRPTLQYNKQHFFGAFKKIITNELVDNFDTCIRLYNNGRIDGRELPTLTNLDGIKNLLSS